MMPASPDVHVQLSAELYIRAFPCAAHIITFQHLETHGGRNNYLEDMWKQAHTPFLNREMKPTVNRPVIRSQALKNLSVSDHRPTVRKGEVRPFATPYRTIVPRTCQVPVLCGARNPPLKCTEPWEWSVCGLTMTPTAFIGQLVNVHITAR